MLLITGITGHTGRFFMQELINNKYMNPIRCIIRTTSDTTFIDRSGLSIEKAVGNLDKQEFIEKTMVGVETVLHIYNIHHSVSIVKSAILNSVKRVILVHTTGVFSNFKSASIEYRAIENEIYELTKDPRCATQVTILRPTMIYGDLCDHNMSKFIKAIDKLRIMPLIDRGESLIQPVNARDLGRAYYDVLTRPEQTDGKQYNLSGDRPITIREAFCLISEELGKSTKFISIPLSTGVFIAKSIKLITFGKIDYIEKIQRMGENRSFSHQDSANDFNFVPMSFIEGIRIEIRQYQMKQMNNLNESE